MKITYKGVTKDLKYYKGLPWNKPLTEKMKQFQEETGKNAIWNGVVTGTFEYWMYWRKTTKPIKKKPVPKKQQVAKKKIVRRTPSNIKSRKIDTKKVDESSFYIKQRHGTATKPKIEKYMLNNHEVKYNWTKGQLYVDEKKIGEPDTIYGRDFIKYAKKYSPKLSPDSIQSTLMYNRDYALKQGWINYANTINQFANSLGVNIE